MVLRLARTASKPATPNDDDLALLAAVATGDMSAFETLHGRYHRRVFGFALRLTGRFEVAEEVVGDTMMVVWRRAADFEGRSKVSTWILGIAYRTALKARKRAAVENLHDEIDDDLPAERTGPEELDALFERRQVMAALRQLPTEQRAIVELTYYYGYKLIEIAQITDCPVGTVKTRMFHARAKLRGLLGGRAMAEGGAG
ncbi:MAG: sigma-70 family RNA polymerase sigma factor [Pseudomonadota bacterium]